MKRIDLKNISAGTLARLALLAAALINTALEVFGMNPISEDSPFVKAAGIAVTVLAALYSYWKNNSFTPEAIEGDRLMNSLKEKNK